MDFEQSGKYQDLLEIISETYHQSPIDPDNDPILNIQSAEGERYYLSFAAGHCSVNWGNHPLASAQYSGPIDTFIDILRKKIDPVRSILEEKISVEGDIAFFIHLRNQFTLVDSEKIDELFEESSSVTKGPLKVTRRVVFTAFMLSGLLLQIMNFMGFSQNTVMIPFSMATLVAAYVALTGRITIWEVLLYLIFPVISASVFFQFQPISENIFFLYNLYMMLIFTGSFYFDRTILSRFNTVNINGREYLDQVINDHNSDITLLWILLFNLGIAVKMIPWGSGIYSILAGNVYVLFFILLEIYSFLELKTC